MPSWENLNFTLVRIPEAVELSQGVGQTSRYLWNHVLEGVHDLGTFGFWVVGEATSEDDDGRQHHTEVQLGGDRWVRAALLRVRHWEHSVNF